MNTAVAAARTRATSQSWENVKNDPAFVFTEVLPRPPTLSQDARLYVSSEFHVIVRDLVPLEPGLPPMKHLSLRRNDRAGRPSWPDMQRIKNAIVGPECEGVELYPAESRLVDLADQYHLWVLADPRSSFAFGFNERAVRETPANAPSSVKPAP